ncbi:MAG: hypothetical protein R3F34_04865 [Planctomycetota bacterium]
MRARTIFCLVALLTGSQLTGNGLLSAFTESTASTTASIAVTGADGGETDPQQDDELVDPALRASAKRVEALTNGLKGAWRLVRFHPAAPAADPAQASGLLLVGDNILTIQLQTVPQQTTSRLPEPVVQVGAHYWRIGPLETLELASVTGFDNASGDVRFEPSLEPREYVPTIVGTRLVLAKPDGTRLEFDRFDVNSFPPQAIRFVEAMRAGRNLDDLRK